MPNSKFSPRPTCLTRPTCPSHLNPPSFLILKKSARYLKLNTNNIRTIQEERRISEKLAKIKYLIFLPKLEKHSVLPTRLTRPICVFYAVCLRLKSAACCLTFIKIPMQIANFKIKFCFFKKSPYICAVIRFGFNIANLTTNT